MGDWRSTSLLMKDLHSNSQKDLTRRERFRCCLRVLQYTRRLFALIYQRTLPQPYWGLVDLGSWPSSFFIKWDTRLWHSRTLLVNVRQSNTWGENMQTARI